jgi:transposase InsO family protein
MQKINIDTIGPLPADDRGNQYLIVIIDCFSRFVELYEVPDTSARYAAQALLEHISRYCDPEIILSDNGTQYVNSVIDELIKLMGPDHELTTAYSHEENGLVERANKEVMRHLRAILFDKNIYSQWAVYKPLVQRIINSEVHKSTGLSPRQIIFGNAMNLNKRVFQEPQSKSLSAYMSNLLLQQQTVIEIAEKNQRFRDELNRWKRFPDSLTEFPVNSYVLVEYPEGRAPTKFHPLKKGPLKVMSFIGRRYKLLNLVTNKEETHDISKLTPFTYDDSTIDPRQIANKDYQVFDVERIIKHQCGKNINKVGDMDFLVKWVGMDDSMEFNRWLEWKELRNNPALHKYLFENNMSKFIPKEHRKASY